MENQENQNNNEPLAPFLNKAVGRNALNFGLLTGAALLIFSFILYLLDLNMKTGLTNVSFVILIGGIVYGIWYYKMKENSGFLSIGKGVATGTLIALYAAIVSSIYMLLMMTVIDPGMVDKMIEMAEEKMLETNPNMEDAEYDVAMSMMDKFMNPYMMAIMSLFWFVLAGLIVSLITSAIIKKDPDTLS